MTETIEILHTGFVTHDTKRFLTTRPDDLEFEPGQGVEVAIPEGARESEGRPFTPTSLPSDPVLEFTIKRYPEREAVTDALHSLSAGDRLTVSEAFGTITYEGPGSFIAGGAGVTPFLAILRSLNDASPDELSECDLLFSNRKLRDVICEKELRHLLNERCHLTLTDEEVAGYDGRHIDRAYLQSKLGHRLEDAERRFYVCGPPRFVDDVVAALKNLGVDGQRIVVEK